MELEPAVEKSAPNAPDAAPKPVQQDAEPRPFFGGAPDDPGVKDRKLEPEPKTRLKLF
jgi:HemY protein